jgi:ribosomal protein S1
LLKIGYFESQSERFQYSALLWSPSFERGLKKTISDLAKYDDFTHPLTHSSPPQVIPAGVLVQLPTGATGLCHYSEVFDSVPLEIANRKLGKGETGRAYHPVLQSHFSPGDKLKCFVLLVDQDAQKIGLGLKPSYFDEDAKEEEEEVRML